MKVLYIRCIDMLRRSFLILAATAALAACAPRTTTPQIGPDGQPLPVAYKISSRDAAQIPTRVQTEINTLRASQGLGPLAMNPQLSAAAQAHATDMARQNRAWAWGSDGSSPLDRVRRAGYGGPLVGQNISETYETEIQTLQAWMNQRDTRDVIMSQQASQMGFAWLQEQSGKIWWTLVIGG